MSCQFALMILLSCLVSGCRGPEHAQSSVQLHGTGAEVVALSLKAVKPGRGNKVDQKGKHLLMVEVRLLNHGPVPVVFGPEDLRLMTDPAQPPLSASTQVKTSEKGGFARGLAMGAVVLADVILVCQTPGLTELPFLPQIAEHLPGRRSGSATLGDLLGERLLGKDVIPPCGAATGLVVFFWPARVPPPPLRVRVAGKDHEIRL